MENIHKKVMLVGLCGRSGSGKGYTAELFSQLGIPSIDTDAVYRNMTAPSDRLSPCMQELAARFGCEVVAEDNSLDRAAMRKIVFSGDTDALQDLNRITHRHILEKTMQEADDLAGRGYRIILIDAPLLFESGFDTMCACSICVTAPEETVLRRIMRRDGISEEDAKRRLAAQIPADALAAKTDYRIVNDCEKNILLGRVQSIADELQKIYDKKYGQY